MVTKIVSLVMSEESIAQIDEIRGDVPRSAYVRHLIDKDIEKHAKGGKKKHG